MQTSVRVVVSYRSFRNSLNLSRQEYISDNGLFPLPDSDSDSGMDSCTMQDFSIGSDFDSDPLIEMYVIEIQICPWDTDLSQKWVQYAFEKGIQIRV